MHGIPGETVMLLTPVFLPRGETLDWDHEFRRTTQPTRGASEETGAPGVEMCSREVPDQNTVQDRRSALLCFPAKRKAEVPESVGACV
eukprot:CAMPEP_0174352744 /NCGR_PEP_ID=MMETSP0811_2-20130205/12135_1 /TAXON_ID=73025 ORGANISM="Eutreptiella gymnastica-like, Strain CCMP1594" /NCGR_SAMPLE_ID=MMETSP0811_2 /ASSEMBLY_ACC=CAM_ASM_000667 /LENGTH=87 /DNA_ID=CAMNT_0015482983 /DNA_START=449 /DNA_END=713 /DNA_ORIENTATION=+